MKSLSYAFLAAAAACGMAAAETAYTVPVGYETITVPAQTDTVISIPLQTATAWSGASTGISGNQISVAAGSFTANQFVYAQGVQSNTYMAQVTSGALIGRFFKITANDTASVTVDPVGANSLQSQGFVSTDTIAIRPYWTLNTLFPSGAPIGASSYDNPQNQVFLTLNSPASPTGVNRSSTNQYYFDNGADSGFPFDGTPQWADQNFNKANDVIIDPANGVSIRNVSASPISIVVTGTVHSVKNANLVVASTVSNDHIVQQPYAVNMTLDQSKLYESGAVKPTTDWTSPTDLVLVYNPTATGFNPSASKIYNYITDPQFTADLGMPVPGWYDSDFNPAGSAALPSGGGIVIRKSPGAAFEASTWTAPLPYTP